MKFNRIFIILLLLFLIPSVCYADTNPFDILDFVNDLGLDWYLQEINDWYDYASEYDFNNEADGLGQDYAAWDGSMANVFQDLFTHDNVYSQSVLFDDSIDGSHADATHFGSTDGYIHFDMADNIQFVDEASLTVGLLHWVGQVPLEDVAKANEIIMATYEFNEHGENHSDIVNEALKLAGLDNLEFMEAEFVVAEDGSLMSADGNQKDGSWEMAFVYGRSVGEDGVSFAKVEAVTHVAREKVPAGGN